LGNTANIRLFGVSEQIRAQTFAAQAFRKHARPTSQFLVYLQHEQPNARKKTVPAGDSNEDARASVLQGFRELQGDKALKINVKPAQGPLDGLLRGKMLALKQKTPAKGQGNRLN